MIDNTGTVGISAEGTTFQIRPAGGAATAVFLASGSVGIGGSTITDVNLLNVQGDASTKNVGIVLNKTNSTAQIWSMQVNNTTGGLYFHNYTASNTPVKITTSGVIQGTSDAEIITSPIRKHSNTISTNTTIATTENAIAGGPINVATGVTLTINGNFTVV